MRTSAAESRASWAVVETKCGLRRLGIGCISAGVLDYHDQQVAGALGPMDADRLAPTLLRQVQRAEERLGHQKHEFTRALVTFLQTCNDSARTHARAPSTRLGRV